MTLTLAQRGTLFVYLRQQHASMVDACRQVGVIDRDEVVPPPTDEELRAWVRDIRGRARPA